MTSDRPSLTRAFPSAQGFSPVVVDCPASYLISTSCNVRWASYKIDYMYLELWENSPKLHKRRRRWR